MNFLLFGKNILPLRQNLILEDLIMWTILIIAVILAICLGIILYAVETHDKHHTHYGKEHHHLFKHYRKQQKNDVENLKTEQKELMDKLSEVQSRLKELVDFKYDGNN